MGIGFYAGSFDPFTIGHLEVLKKACKIFDKVIIGIGVNPDKKRRFSEDKMKEAILSVFENEQILNVEVVIYDGLTVDCARKYDASFLVRGIRNEIDYGFEENLASINQEVSGLDTIYIRAGNFSVVSSSMVYELFKNNKDITKYVPKEILNTMQKNKEN